MILGHMEALENIDLYPKALQTALYYLKDHDFTKMDLGTYEIDGKNIYAMVQEMKSEPVEDRRAESHVDYLDIQYLFQGAEKIGYGLLDDSVEVKEDKRPEKDVIFYEGIDRESFLELKEGSFAVFFPRDIHRPGCQVDSPQTIKKVVVKIKTSLL